MPANYLLSGSAVIGWYLGAVVLDVVKGARVLDYLMHTVLHVKMDYKKNNVSTDRENGRGNKRARVTRGSWNPKHGKRKPYIVHKPSRLN
jgi:hypothetical protein